MKNPTSADSEKVRRRVEEIERKLSTAINYHRQGDGDPDETDFQSLYIYLQEKGSLCRVLNWLFLQWKREIE